MTSLKAALVIPTLNAGDNWQSLIASIRGQEVLPDPILVIDSSSSDGTPHLAMESGCKVRVLQKNTFSHGRTRMEAIESQGDLDLVVFLSQDAVLHDSRAIASLLEGFEDPMVAAAFGCQLPDSSTSPIESHFRQFNYPSKNFVRSLSDPEPGSVNLPFLSNTFAAYRVKVLREVGGFPDQVIMCEDMYATAKMLLAGWKVAYRADARVIHAHDYTIGKYFRRSFDIGVFHARERWIRQTFGVPEADGLRYVASQLKYLAGNAPHLIPLALFHDGLRYLGYRAGLLERFLPLWLKRTFSLNRNFWSRRTKGVP